MSAAPRIQFLGGIGTIGGTKVFVQEGEHRVLFDFGTTYNPAGDFWGARLHPRTGAGGLRDLVGLGYLPKVNGLYQPAAAEGLGLTPGHGDRTHVFISHLHLDHMSAVDALADEVPVWMHHDSVRMFRVLAATGENPAVPGGLRGFSWGEAIPVGPIKVTPVAVDHDIPGASALLIETSAGTVAYTGDLRLHGSHPELTLEFVRHAAALRPKMLLIEGTRLGEPEPAPDRPAPLSEPEVAPRVAKLAGKAGGLALITLYPRNLPRLTSIAAEVSRVGRTLVLSPETAFTFAAMGGDLERVGIYRRFKDARELELGSAPQWLTGIFASGATVLDAAAIAKAQRKYLLQLFYWDLGELVDLQPWPGSVFIHSNGEPLGRFDPAYEVFIRWLNRFGLELLHTSSTGHASPADLLRMVGEIDPEIAIPIHSRAPELLEVTGVRRLLPEPGATYAVGTGERL